MIKNRIHSLSGNERFELIPAWPAMKVPAEEAGILLRRGAADLFSAYGS